MSKKKRPPQRIGVSGQHPPFPRRASLRMALGLTALTPGVTLAAFPANINLGSLDGTNGFRLDGVAAGDRAGIGSSAGDVNGDGGADLLIGAFGADPNGSYSGASYVVFGEPPPPPAPPLSPATCNGLPATIVGTSGNNTLAGTPGDDVIHGLGGNDRISGLAGNDVLCGGPGLDRLSGGPSRDRLLGQGGGDIMNGGGSRDRCDGGSGRDRATRCEQPRNVP